MLPRAVRHAIAVGCLLFVAGTLIHQPSRGADPSPAQSSTPAQVKPIEPRPLSAATTKGLAYLVSQQQKNGGWGQGGGWRTGGQNGGRREGSNVEDPTDLGNTCVATLALIRAGNTPKAGPYADHVARAAGYICEQIKKSDNDSLYVTSVRDTQLQQKIGQYVDTFLAGLVLSELKGQMPSDAREHELVAALDKTITKIERNQQEDGNFAGNHGWAPVLSQGLCSKFLNRAAQQKLNISAKVLERDYAQTVAQLDRKTGDFRGEKPAASAPLGASTGARPGRGAAAVVRSEASDAGVDLYNTASNAGRVHFYYDANRRAEQAAKQTLASAEASPELKQQAESELRRVNVIRGAQQAAVGGVMRKLKDEQFVAGFGNNGGEEFLSYMNISEMLCAKGGEEWTEWNEAISKKLADVQNNDGSWSGHHCITGRTFCTATALLTLMADRASGQLAAQIKDQL